MNILVIGGAGYIGSHMVRQLDRAGHNVVILDNLSTGFAEAVTAGQLIVGNMQDRPRVQQILDDHQIESVMHFAACALVGESVVEPAKYYQNNVLATLELLEAMRYCDVKKIVFSSTCATYGQPLVVPITENEKQEPVNPYGFTKLVVERALEDYSHAYGLKFAALRYFNAAGASPEGGIGEDHQPESCREVTGCEIVEVVGDRRPGDPPKLIADPSLANSVLGWEPQYQSPLPIIQTAWNWHQTHPHGYQGSQGSPKK